MEVVEKQADFETAILTELVADLNTCLKDNSSVHILLSGGSTPGPVYQQLNATFAHLSRLKIGLVDERFVPSNHPKSNELLLRACFVSPAIHPTNIVGMVTDPSDMENNLNLIRECYAPFIERTDIIILGMGPDGHTASIFPNDPQSDFALNTPDRDLFNTRSPQFPEERITCSFALLNQARFIYLLISGKEKRDLILSDDQSLPIHRFLTERKDLKIYYLDHD